MIGKAKTLNMISLNGQIFQLHSHTIHFSPQFLMNGATNTQVKPIHINSLRMNMNELYSLISSKLDLALVIL